MTPKKIASFAVGPIGSALLGFLTLPIITWYFSQEDVGRIAMLSIVSSFVTLLFSLGLDQAYVREFHETKNQQALLKTTILPGLILLTLTIFILLLFGNIISLRLFEIDSHLLSILVAISVISTFISRFLSLILRMNEQGLAYSMSQILPKILLVLIIGGYVIISANKDFLNLMIANVTATLLVCIIYAWNTRNVWFIALRSKID